MTTIGVIVLIPLYLCLFLFPIWEGLLAWRKNRKAITVLIYLGCAVGFGWVIALLALPVVKPWRFNRDYSPNPRSIGGCGTAFLGAALDDPARPDQSFITTEWFRLFYLPLIPIMSYRVSYVGSTSKGGFWSGYISETTTFTVHECVGLSRRGVAAVITSPMWASGVKRQHSEHPAVLHP